MIKSNNASEDILRDNGPIVSVKHRNKQIWQWWKQKDLDLEVISLTYSNSVNVLYNFDCSNGYWKSPIQPEIINGLINGKKYHGIYAIPFDHAQNVEFPADYMTVNGLNFNRELTIGSIQGEIIYSIDGIYTGENGKIIQSQTLEGCTINVGKRPENCKEILNALPLSPNGVYTIDPDAMGELEPFEAYCDMITDVGGWTLILNYNHKGGTNPALSYKTTNLPLMGNQNLGEDESLSDHSKYWGHASNQLLSLFNFNEIRFYAITSQHNRIIHFKTNASGVRDYIRKGIGNMSSIKSSFIPFMNHSANLPNSADSYFSDKGDNALIDFPFYKSNTYHWGIQGTGVPSGIRWEVDNFPANSSNDTFHQVWIR